MPVRGDELAKTAFEQRPAKLFGLRSVTACQRRRVDLQNPAACREVVRDRRILQDRFGPFRMCDDRS